jgi:hypothetical protein
MTTDSLTQVKSLAPNLATGDFPRSPRETIADYVIAGRTLDKCRADLAGSLGDYHFDCPLDNLFFDFPGITADAFKSVVGTGADDDAVAAWIGENSKVSEPRDIIQWNNDLRGRRISEMPIELQEFLESYIPENIPAGRVVYVWFDVYDIEEGRL